MAGSSLSSFLSALVTNAIIACVFIILFCILKRRYPAFYVPRALQPRGKDKSHNVPAPPDSMFGWLRPVLFMDRDEFVRYAGLDAYMFCRFLLFGVRLFAILTFLGFVVLLPANAVGGNNKQDGFDKVSMSNVSDKQGQLLWVHWASVWVYSFIVFYLLMKVSKDFVELRHRQLLKAEVQNYSVVVLGLDKDCTSDDLLWDGFQRLFPGQLDGVALVRDTKTLADPKTLHDDSVKAFEHAVTVYKNKAAEKGAPVSGAKADGDVPIAASPDSHSDLRPQHKPDAKCFCIGGTKVDSIEYHAKQIQRSANDLARIRDGSLAPLPAGFVTFNNLLAPQTAVQALQFSNPDTVILPAPEPEAVLWDNLDLSERSKTIRLPIVTAAVYALVFFWTIPVAFVSSLANLKQLAQNKGFHWVNSVIDVNPTLTGLLQGYLPTIILAVFMSLLPAILAALTQVEGVVSTTLVHFGVIRKFFLFQVFNVFLVTTIAGSVFNSLHKIIDKPTSIVSLLAESLPKVSTFFINYIMLQALASVPMELGRFVPLLIMKLKLKYLAKTRREIAETVAAGSSPQMNWGAVLPLSLLVCMIGLTYSTINPVICPVALLFFFLSLVVWRYNALYVQSSTFQAGGMMWPIMFRRVMVGIYIYQFTLIGLFGLNKAASQSTTLIPLPFVTTAVWWYIAKMYEKVGLFLPAEVVQQATRSESTGAPTQPLMSSVMPSDGSGLGLFSERTGSEGRPSPSPIDATLNPTESDEAIVVREYLHPRRREDMDLRPWVLPDSLLALGEDETEPGPVVDESIESGRTISGVVQPWVKSGAGGAASAAALSRRSPPGERSPLLSGTSSQRRGYAPPPPINSSGTTHEVVNPLHDAEEK